MPMVFSLALNYNQTINSNFSFQQQQRNSTVKTKENFHFSQIFIREVILSTVTATNNFIDMMNQSLIPCGYVQVETLTTKIRKKKTNYNQRLMKTVKNSTLDQIYLFAGVR